jgi:hypothetical protein
LECLRLENVDIYFMVICNISQTLEIFYDHMLHFVFIWYIFRFWYHVPRKLWQPWHRLESPFLQTTSSVFLRRRRQPCRNIHRSDTGLCHRNVKSGSIKVKTFRGKSAQGMSVPLHVVTIFHGTVHV